jgi:hypothetical protein
MFDSTDAYGSAAAGCQCLRMLPVHARRRRVLLHLAAVVLVCLVNLCVGIPAVTLIGGGLFMTLVYVTFGIDEFRKAPLGLSPLSFYFLWDSIIVGPSPIYVGSLILSGAPVLLGPYNVQPEDIATGYLVFLFGSVALHAGFQYQRPLHRCEEGKPSLLSGRGLLALLGVMYVVGLVCLLRPPLVDSLGGALAPLFEQAPITALACLALGAREVRLSRPVLLALLLIGTVGLLVGSLNSGSKASIMFSFLPILWFLSLYHRRWLPLAAVAGICFYSMVWQVVNLARGNLHYYSDLQLITVREQAFDRMLDAFKQYLAGARVTSEADPDPSQHSETGRFLIRQFQPLSVGFIAHEVRESGFLMGTTLDYVAFSFVPRLIWPEKPFVNRGRWFTYHLGMADSPESAKTQTAQYAAGELYWNFGLPGVFVGMGVLGALLGQLWRMAGNDPHRDPLRLMLYLSVMLNLQEMSEAGGMLVLILSQLLVFGTALRLETVLLKRG